MTGHPVTDAVFGFTACAGAVWIIRECAHAIIMDWRDKAAFKREQAAIRAKMEGK